MTTEEIEAKLIELEATVGILMTSVNNLAEAVKTTQDSFSMVLDQMTKGMESK